MFIRLKLCARRSQYAKEKSHPNGWLFSLCRVNTMDQQTVQKYAGILRQQSWLRAAPAIVLSDRQNRLRYAQTLCFAQNCRTVEPQVHCGGRTPKRDAIRMDGISFWQAAPIKISTVFLVFSMVSAFWARFLELAASYCWLLLCNQKRYCGFYGIWCGLHDSVSDLHFDGFPVLRGSGHKSACSAQRG